MYDLLIKLMIISAIAQLGMSLAELKDCRKLEKVSRKVLRIEWKPISIFPEEARKFR
jgi:hypothetical protein